MSERFATTTWPTHTKSSQATCLLAILIKRRFTYQYVLFLAVLTLMSHCANVYLTTQHITILLTDNVS
jgi:hypothetical protein